MGYVIGRKNLEKFAVSPGNFLRKNFNKATYQISRQKLIKEYLVQEIEMLNQLLGTWEKSLTNGMFLPPSFHLCIAPLREIISDSLERKITMAYKRVTI